MAVRVEYYTADLPQPFDIVPVIERLYGTRAIAWDVPVDLFLPSTAEVSTDAPPVLQASNDAKPEQAGTGESWQRLRRTLQGVANQNGKTQPAQKEPPVNP